MAGSALHDVGVPPLSFRALVAESSHCEIKPFCCHFLDAATARSMTGEARSMTVEVRSMTGEVRGVTGEVRGVTGQFACSPVCIDGAGRDQYHARARIGPAGEPPQCVAARGLAG